MSIKKNIFLAVSFLLVACSSDEKNLQKTILPPVVEKINVENIDLSLIDFKEYTSDVSLGKEYVDFSYSFLQTSLFKRHLNTIGLTIDPSNTDYIKRFSYSYKKAGEHQKAMHLLQLSLEEEIDPTIRLNHLSYVAWNYLYFYRDYANAIATVDEIVELSNKDLGFSCHGEVCLILKGQALYRMKKYEEAIQVFSTYQAHEKEQGFYPMDNPLLVFYKARCLAEIGQSEEAELYFSHLLKNNPHAEASFQIAKLHFANKNYDLANKFLVDTEKAIQLGYSFKEPYFERFDKVFVHQVDELRKSMSSK